MQDHNALIPYLFPFLFPISISSFFLQWNRWGLYRHKPCAAELWKRSQKVDGFDFFISHTWRTPGRWKILSLLMRLRTCSLRFFDSKSGLSLLPPLHLFCCIWVWCSIICFRRVCVGTEAVRLGAWTVGWVLWRSSNIDLGTCHLPSELFHFCFLFFVFLAFLLTVLSVLSLALAI